MSATAQQIVSAIEAAILVNPLTTSVTVDGQTINFGSLADRDRTHQYWKTQAAISSGTRRRMFAMDLSRGGQQ